MSGWLILSAYLAGWFVAARTALAFIDNHEELADEDQIGRVMLTVVCCLLAIVWPLWFPVALVAMTRRKSPRELRQQVAERDRRIAELERELGIGGTG